MTATLFAEPAAKGLAAPEPAGLERPAFDGPYRVVLERLRRLVAYRRQLLSSLDRDPGQQRPAAELVRVRHMIREVHRAVSMNATARLHAEEIDPEAGRRAALAL